MYHKKFLLSYQLLSVIWNKKFLLWFLLDPRWPTMVIQQWMTMGSLWCCGISFVMLISLLFVLFVPIISEAALMSTLLKAAVTLSSMKVYWSLEIFQIFIYLTKIILRQLLICLKLLDLVAQENHNRIMCNYWVTKMKIMY